MSKIVCHKSAEGECAGCVLLLAVRESEAEHGSGLAENAAGHEFKHKARRSVAMGWPVYIPISADSECEGLVRLGSITQLQLSAPHLSRSLDLVCVSDSSKSVLSA